MIEGLKVTIKGDELRSLCVTRSNHHTNREAFYVQKQKDLAGINLHDGRSSGRDPADDLKNKAEGHNSSAAELQFIADHIVLDETYILDRADLAKLGIGKSFY